MNNKGYQITYTGEEVQELLDKAGTAVQTETDPTVPSWAKAEEKPTYTATEVGALPDDTELFSGSYNDLTDKPTIPDSLSDLSDDSTHRLVTDAEKTAWNGKSDFSGSYDDLTDKPTIPAAQVNADWNATSGVAKILNKPTIPAEQIQSDWNQSNTSAKDYIKNKPTIPDISNCITKSSTSGLVKNDGSIDTNTYLTQHQDISNYVQKSNTTGLLKNDGTVDTNTYLTSAPVTSVNGQTGAVSLSIPTESTVSGWGFTKNAGTITGINMNGASKGTSGVVDLGTVITAHQDISGKADKSEMGVSTSGDQTTITLKSGTSATVINQHQSLSGYVQTSNTAGLIKNDGTIDTTSYGTYSKPSGGIPASDIASGVIPTVPSNIVTGSSQSYTIEVVAALPATPDADTIYLITGS